jgi:RecA/RadA recombinase
VFYGPDWTVSGGDALKFYSSQRIVLRQCGKIEKGMDGKVLTKEDKAESKGKKLTRVIGVNVEALVYKNKVGEAYGKVRFPIMFGYGVDDEKACRMFLAAHKVQVRGKKSIEELHAMVEQTKTEFDQRFAPAKRKYG